ncbi:hypothetical protein B0T17DRAFT_247510 [Bombardia bombarda]|uniref:Uncharacterized protein n=1 Tax=Bombardia bombarda TaxID=252184 RepID=A0AA39WZY6_9PEZI|nr:hypothetical protein B0T17DRAFT_247510 [Bombardia bombarda]
MRFFYFTYILRQCIAEGWAREWGTEAKRRRSSRGGTVEFVIMGYVLLCYFVPVQILRKGGGSREEWDSGRLPGSVRFQSSMEFFGKLGLGNGGYEYGWQVHSWLSSFLFSCTRAGRREGDHEWGNEKSATPLVVGWLVTSCVFLFQQRVRLACR